MVKTLELAVAKAAALPDEAQECLGRELLQRIESISALRGAIDAGLRELDRGEGEELDIEQFIAQIRREDEDG